MTLRILLAATLVAGSTLCGKSLAGSARRRAELLASLAAGMRALSVRMMNLFEPLPQGLAACGCPMLTQLAAEMADGRSAGEAWSALRKHRRGPSDSLTEADTRILDSLFERLGESGRAQQELLLSGAAQSLECQRDEARARAGEAERLYVTLGLLIGLMLALIVI